ncbi:MAG: NAD-binding protein [Candidatus Micrarchaeaceae archaeon]
MKQTLLGWDREMATLARNVEIYIIAVAVVLAYGITGTYVLGTRGDFRGFSKSQDTLINATYYTVVTLSTVGYGDIVPATPIAKLFVVSLILIGLGVFLSAVAVIGGEFMNSRIEALAGRVSAFDKRLFNKHIILIGTNSTNLYLAAKLKEMGERFIIITSDRGKAEQLRTNGYATFVADATSDTDMAKFNLDKALSIVIDVKDSSRTIYVLLIAKELGKNAKIIALASSEEAARHIKSLNVASLVVNPSDIAAREISGTIFKDEEKRKHL